MLKSCSPNDLFDYVNKYVCVTCKSNRKQINGWVYTIDPLTLSTVLIEFENEELAQVNVINGEEIDKIIKITKQTTPIIEEKLSNLFKNKMVQQNNEILVERKKKLVEILDKNRIPYVENEENNLFSIMDSVVIRAPYFVENCESTNEIILKNIQNIVSKIN
jgi:hypothetical protein